MELQEKVALGKLTAEAAEQKFNLHLYFQSLSHPTINIHQASLEVEQVGGKVIVWRRAIHPKYPASE